MNSPSRTFPSQRADQLPAVAAQIPWLIQDLWTDQAVGILGGEPKCCKSFLALADLPLHVITAPSMRLDLASDRQRLSYTIEALQPVLLVLDPLIRLHQRDENDASPIAPLLGFLRQLQRQFHVAVLLVHHAKKDGASLRPGQALRGSSELHGWGDSNLYLRRHRDQLSLTVEHRA